MKIPVWPTDFEYVNMQTSDRLSTKELQEAISDVCKSEVPVVMIESGDTIVARVDREIIVSRNYFRLRKNRRKPNSK